MSERKFLISFDGAKIFYHLSRGTKRPAHWLVFLHGFGGDLTAWSKERRYFTSKGYSTLAMDLRGHGLSDRSEEVDFYRFEHMARDVELVMAKENISHAVVVGHCFGGMVAMYLASKQPSFLKGLVLIDTGNKLPFVGKTGVSLTLLKRLFGFLASHTPNVHLAARADFSQFEGGADIDPKRILSDMVHTSLHSYLLICEAAVNLKASALLGKINAPTLILEGTEDSIFPPEVAEGLHKRIKRSEIDFIEGANHILVISNPQEVNLSVERFLEKLMF